MMVAAKLKTLRHRQLELRVDDWNDVRCHVRRVDYYAGGVDFFAAIQFHCVIVETEQAVHAVRKCGYVVAFEEQFRHVRSAVVRVAHRLCQ